VKPMGRKTFGWPNKVDCHPPKGYVNWWENLLDVSKKRERREAKRQIQKDLED
jgi:hypothetical protein